MATDIEQQLRNYFDWVEDRTGHVLRPTATTRERVAAARSSSGPAGSEPRPAASSEDHRERGARLPVLIVAASIVAVVAGLAVLQRDTSDPSPALTPAPAGPPASATPTPVDPDVEALDANEPDVDEPDNDGRDTGAPMASTPATSDGPASELTPTTSLGVPGPTADAMRLVVGSSLVLGAAGDLAAGGFVVDAIESRSPFEVVEYLQSIDRSGIRLDTVVVDIGFNGSIGERNMDDLVEALDGVPRVVLLTLRLDRDYVAPNNDLIRATAADHANISVLDWEHLADTCPGDCFEADGIHLRPDGRRYLSEVLDDHLEFLEFLAADDAAGDAPSTSVAASGD